MYFPRRTDQTKRMAGRKKYTTCWLKKTPNTYLLTIFLLYYLANSKAHALMSILNNMEIKETYANLKRAQERLIQDTVWLSCEKFSSSMIRGV